MLTASSLLEILEMNVTTTRSCRSRVPRRRDPVFLVNANCFKDEALDFYKPLALYE